MQRSSAEEEEAAEPSFTVPSSPARPTFVAHPSFSGNFKPSLFFRTQKQSALSSEARRSADHSADHSADNPQPADHFADSTDERPVDRTTQRHSSKPMRRSSGSAERPANLSAEGSAERPADRATQQSAENILEDATPEMTQTDEDGESNTTKSTDPECALLPEDRHNHIAGIVVADFTSHLWFDSSDNETDILDEETPREHRKKKSNETARHKRDREQRRRKRKQEGFWAFWQKNVLNGADYGDHHGAW